MCMGAHGFEAESQRATHDDSAPSRSGALCRSMPRASFDEYARPSKNPRGPKKNQEEPPFECTYRLHKRNGDVHGGTWFQRRYPTHDT